LDQIFELVQSPEKSIPFHVQTIGRVFILYECLGHVCVVYIGQKRDRNVVVVFDPHGGHFTRRFGDHGTQGQRIKKNPDWGFGLIKLKLKQNNGGQRVPVFFAHDQQTIVENNSTKICWNGFLE
jgi:hypothetical protein